jgi:hypothetical protein
MSTPTGLRSEALSRRPATPWQLSQGEEAEVMRERMTEFEYIIEYLDENDVARDADTQCFATHAEAERVAEHVLGNGQGRQGATPIALSASRYHIFDGIHNPPGRRESG